MRLLPFSDRGVWEAISLAARGNGDTDGATLAWAGCVVASDPGGAARGGIGARLPSAVRCGDAETGLSWASGFAGRDRIDSGDCSFIVLIFKCRFLPVLNTFGRYYTQSSYRLHTMLLKRIRGSASSV